ncbi:hypothetical protein FF2_037587 [Malus domestica]
MAECKHCKLLVPAHSIIHGTSGILKHLKKCLGSSLFKSAYLNQLTLTQGRMRGAIFTHIFNKKRLDRRCVRWIIIVEMPFRVVNQEDLQAFIRDLNPKYKLPNRHKVPAMVLELFFEEKVKIKITSHKGDDIGRCLKGCLNDWGIDKVFSITIDNASANDTAIAYIKRRLK